jgi:DNA-directed RNA polymerase subunit M
MVKQKKNIKGITILEKDTTPLPQTSIACPECSHSSAYWWMQQTRSDDEPPTQFFRCAKCKHVWREYK